jgi:uncharacterized protein (TIGR03435 family)
MSVTATALLFLQVFTVASVKTSPGGPPSIVADPGRIDYNNITLKTIITRAYGVKDYQVSGPAWLSSQVYQVTATMAPDTSEKAFQVMFQSLLTERFQLKLHRTSQEMAVYALVPAKGGPKLQKAEGEKMSIANRNGRMEGRAMTTSNLVNVLAAMVDRPVVDMTEIPGAFDFNLEFGADSTLSPAMAKMSLEQSLSARDSADVASGPSIFSALQNQLGLKLEPRKAPVEVLVIDSASKVPTEN